MLECYRTNAKFSDPDFDIEHDFFSGVNNCRYGLNRMSSDDIDDDSDDDSERHGQKLGVDNRRRCLPESNKDDPYMCGPEPGSIHRIPWIFENPRFTVDSFSSSDIKQGAIGNCWWLAGLATIAHRKDLMKKICVARDEECGVYGFVFYRDGEWISTVVDDNLYLKEKDFGQDSEIYDATGKKARRYKKEKQTGSEALFYAKCNDANETWLPLLEKAVCFSPFRFSLSSTLNSTSLPRFTMTTRLCVEAGLALQSRILPVVSRLWLPATESCEKSVSGEKCLARIVKMKNSSLACLPAALVVTTRMVWQ